MKRSIGDSADECKCPKHSKLPIGRLRQGAETTGSIASILPIKTISQAARIDWDNPRAYAVARKNKSRKPKAKPPVDKVPDVAASETQQRGIRWRYFSRTMKVLTLMIIAGSVVMIWRQNTVISSQSEIAKAGLDLTSDQIELARQELAMQQEHFLTARRTELAEVIFGNDPVAIGVKPSLIAEYVKLERERLKASNPSYSVLCETKVDLKSIDFSGLDLRGIDLANTNLRQVAAVRTLSLKNADLTGACLNGQILRAADLVGAKLDYSDCQVCDLEGANFSMSSLRHAKLNFSNLKNVSFYDADLFDAELCGVWGVSRTTVFLSKNSSRIKTFTNRVQKFFPENFHESALSIARPQLIAQANLVDRFAIGVPVRATSTSEHSLLIAASFHERAKTFRERLGENAIPQQDSSIVDQDTGIECSY